jgi:hypothetical protein
LAKNGTGKSVNRRLQVDGKKKSSNRNTRR